MNKIIIAFILEGISIGFTVSSMTVLSSIWVDEVEDGKKKLWILWFTNMFIAMTAHVIASAYRHDRVLNMVNKIGNMNLGRNLRKSFDSRYTS